MTKEVAARLRNEAARFAEALKQPVMDSNDSGFRHADRRLQRAAVSYTHGMAKRGYSREFKPHGETGKRYLLDEIPAGLWRDVRAKAKREGISLRALILKLLKEWATQPPQEEP